MPGIDEPKAEKYGIDPEFLEMETIGGVDYYPGEWYMTRSPAEKDAASRKEAGQKAKVVQKTTTNNRPFWVVYYSGSYSKSAIRRWQEKF